MKMGQTVEINWRFFNGNIKLYVSSEFLSSKKGMSFFWHSRIATLVFLLLELVFSTPSADPWLEICGLHLWCSGSVYPCNLVFRRYICEMGSVRCFVLSVIWISVIGFRINHFFLYFFGWRHHSFCHSDLTTRLNADTKLAAVVVGFRSSLKTQ